MEKAPKTMKFISKIAILISLVAFVSSCQKENIPVPNRGGDCPSYEATGANQRVVNQHDTGYSACPAVKGELNSDPNEIVGGSDDDRDGGGIVGGGDDDRDGGGKKGKD